MRKRIAAVSAAAILLAAAFAAAYFAGRPEPAPAPAHEYHTSSDLEASLNGTLLSLKNTTEDDGLLFSSWWLERVTDNGSSPVEALNGEIFIRLEDDVIWGAGASITFDLSDYYQMPLEPGTYSFENSLLVLGDGGPWPVGVRFTVE